MTNHPDLPRVWTLSKLFWTYRWQLSGTYALFNLENIISLAQPYVLGIAINDLLKKRYTGLGIFAVQHIAFLLIGSARRLYDTRAFARIYTHVASDVVLDQREAKVELSTIAARSSLSRELVDFFERDVPMTFHSAYAIFGAWVMLLFYDWALTLLCMGMLVPLCLINFVYGKRTLDLNERLNDQIEREVGVIAGGDTREVKTHYGLLAKWRVKLSDWEVMNFGVMEIFILGLMVASLIRFCSTAGATAGSVFAVFTYILTYVTGLDNVPLLVEQFSRLHDIGRRLQSGTAAASIDDPTAAAKPSDSSQPIRTNEDSKLSPSAARPSRCAPPHG